MSDNTKLIFLILLLAAIVGTVRMRYLDARKTGRTRSSIVLRSYNDLWARFRIRLTWCFFPATAIAIFLCVARGETVICILTIAVAAIITVGGAIFDHCLLRYWATNKPQWWDQDTRG